MKIILSRKGFDAGIGGVASPIFPSGELYSLPIPESFPSRYSQRYKEIQVGNRSLGTIVNDLTGGRVKPDTFAHLDPDLNVFSVPRQPNWRPVFGQAGAAEKHLQNQGVKEGDVFVFYGWFRQVELVAGKYRYVRNTPDLHVIFGWLQVEQRIPVASLSEIPAWALDHPHCKATKYRSIDSIYISTSYLHLPGIDSNKPGSGVFPLLASDLCLTAPNKSRSIWQLPNWFYPHENTPGLSYHSSLHRWKLDGDTVLLNTVGRGQEFVLDCQDYPEAIQWLSQLLRLYDIGSTKPLGWKHAPKRYELRMPRITPKHRKPNSAT
ncbi:MAG: hypothetical protein ACJ795_23245 [Ktedonobacteraceae bacterium]